MKPEDFQIFLSKYNKEKAHAQKRARHHQIVAKRLEWGLISCSAVTTILVPLSALWKTFLIIFLTTLSSALVTGIATVMKTLKTQEKWSFYQKLYHDLDLEYYRYIAQSESYQKFKDKEALFTQRVLVILDEANKKMPNSTLSTVDVGDFYQQDIEIKRR